MTSRILIILAVCIAATAIAAAAQTEAGKHFLTLLITGGNAS